MALEPGLNSPGWSHIPLLGAGYSTPLLCVAKIKSVMVSVGDPTCCSPLDFLEGSHTFGVGIPD